MVEIGFVVIIIIKYKLNKTNVFILKGVKLHIPQVGQSYNSGLLSICIMSWHYIFDNRTSVLVLF